MWLDSSRHARATLSIDIPGRLYCCLPGRAPGRRTVAISQSRRGASYPNRGRRSSRAVLPRYRSGAISSRAFDGWNDALSRGTPGGIWHPAVHRARVARASRAGRPSARHGIRAATGLAGLSVGVLRALNLERRTFPPLLSIETSLPVGTLAATQLSYLVKGLVTKTTALGGCM